MTGARSYTGLSTPRAIGKALARDLPAPTLRHFMVSLDEVLDGMRQGLLDAGHPIGTALHLCREAREAGLTAWQRHAGSRGGGEAANDR